MADENYFDPSFSPNLPEQDPLRAWVSQVQSDPELKGLMATDPQAAMDRMKTLGIPPPPQGFSAYADGLGTENTVPPIPPYRSARSGPGTYGGADQPAPTPAPTSAPTTNFPQRNLPNPIVQTNRDGSIKGNVSDLDPQYTDPMGGVGGAPAAPGDPDFTITKPGATFGYIGGGHPPAPLPREVNPNPVPGGYIPVPMRDPRKAEMIADAGAALDPISTAAHEEEANKTGGSTDVSAKKKKADAEGGFSDLAKGLQGVKPPTLPAPQKISTPSAPQHSAMQAPNLAALLSLVGQPASPIAMTLGRLLATGKA